MPVASLNKRSRCYLALRGAAEPRRLLEQLLSRKFASRSGHRDEATAFARAALAIRPQSSAAHNVLGNALSVQLKQEEAIAAFRKAIELNPKSRQPLHQPQ